MLSKTRTRSHRVSNNAQPAPGENNNSKQAPSTSRRSMPSSEGKINQGPIPNSIDSSNIDQSMKEHIANLHKSFDDIKNQLELQNKSLTSKMHDISTKLSVMDKLVQENALLKERVKNLECDVAKLQNDCKMDGIDTITSEIEERNRRRNNVIVFNVEESAEEDREKSLNDDRKRIYNLLRVADQALTIADMKCFRLGKKDRNKPRPVKVILNNQSHVSELMKNRTKIQGSIKIFRDQTVIQRNLFLKLKDELNTRTRKGEKNLYIKFVKGAPRIFTNGDSKNFNAITKTSGA